MHHALKRKYFEIYSNKYLLLKNNIKKSKRLQLGGAAVEQEKDLKQSETGSFFDDLFSPKSEEETKEINKELEKQQQLLKNT